MRETTRERYNEREKGRDATSTMVSKCVTESERDTLRERERERERQAARERETGSERERVGGCVRETTRK